LDVFKLGPETSVGAKGSNKGSRKWEAEKKPGLHVLSCGMKSYQVIAYLIMWSQYYHVGQKKTRVTYVIMWDEKLSSYSVLIMWSQYYHVGQNIIIGKNCYRVG
jgi:hypothetical protein